MRSSRSVSSSSTLFAMALLSCSLVIDTAHDVCGLDRCVSVAFAPTTMER